jgi:hypothetical protein
MFECTGGETMMCDEDASLDASALNPCLCYTCADETHVPASVSVDNRAGLLEIILSKDLGGDAKKFTETKNADGTTTYTEVPPERRNAHDQPDGTRWRSMGMKQPARGRKLSNPELAAALKNKIEFTEEEWLSFGIKDLRADDYIITGDLHFSPMDVQSTSALSKASSRRNEVELGSCPSISVDVLIRMDFVGADGNFNEVRTNRQTEEGRGGSVIRSTDGEAGHELA